MPDEKTNPAPDPTPAGTVVPEPQAQPPPVTTPPAAAPTPPATPSSKTPLPEVNPDQVFEIPTADGGVARKTLQEMADAAVAADRTPQIDPKQLEQFQLYQKAAAGDTAAAHALVDQSATKPADDPAESDAEYRTRIESELADLKKTVGAHEPIQRQIRDAQQVSTYDQVIKLTSAKVPYLAHVSDGPQLLKRAMDDMCGLVCQSTEMTPDQFFAHPNINGLLSKAMMNEEARLRNLAGAFAGFKPENGAAAAPTNAPQVVNDQTTPDGTIPARIQVERNTGRVIDASGNPMLQLSHGPMAEIPTQPLNVPPGGAPVAPPVSQLPQAGAFTSDQMKAHVRSRAQQMNEVQTP